MPNGDPDWRKTELPELKAFFKKIARVLKRFAKKYNLKTTKYYHQCPDWDFTFRHPLGGVGQIEVRKCSENHVFINTAWWLDDVESYTRFAKSEKVGKCSIDKAELLAELEQCFKNILSWKKEDLSGKPDPMFKKTWSKSSKEKDLMRYPIPKLD